jgi:hypothetical protein
MNPFVGAIFCVTYAGAVLVAAIRSGQGVRGLLRHATTIVPVAIALAWCMSNQMVEGAGGALQFGWLGDARNAPVTTLLLSLGPALAPAIVGVLAWISARSAIIGRKPDVTAPLLLAVLSILLLYFVRLRVDTSWVGFRAGQMFLVAIPALVAVGLAISSGMRRVAIGVALASLLFALPTTVIDVYNAQDISNFNESPVGPWTVTVTRDEREALDWLRNATPATAVVQIDPIARKRETWSLIPSFAERRMAAGLPISLLDVPEYHEKSARVKTMYETPNPEEAWKIAHSLRIDYVYLDRVERRAYPGGARKFEAAPQYFAPVFHRGDVAVYRVQ